jgi:signal transduction histidine kinase
MNGQPKSDVMGHYERQNYPFSAVGDALLAEISRLKRQLQTERQKRTQVETELRKALSRELHDGPAQLISASIMYLDMCQHIFEENPETALKEVKSTKVLLEKVDHQLRTILFGLRPLTLEAKGLTVALQALLDRLQADMYTTADLKLVVHAEMATGEISRFDKQVEHGLFRIVQECVSNAIKHAEAKNIIVRLTEISNYFQLEIIDDGEGFDVSDVLENYEGRGSLGLVNLKEQAEIVNGDLTISSILGEGTMITVLITK